MRRTVSRVVPYGASQLSAPSRRLASGLSAETLQIFSSKPLQTSRGFSSSFASKTRSSTRINWVPQGFGHLRKPGFQVRGVATRSGFKPTWIGGVVLACVGIGTGLGMTVYASEGPQGQQPSASGQSNWQAGDPSTKEEEKLGLWDKIKKKGDLFVQNLMNAREDRILLPDRLPPPYGKEYVVVIAAEILCCQRYEPQAGGLLVVKRPAVEFFLAELAQNYEIVIFSREALQSWNHLIEKLDPSHHAQHRLFMDSTILRHGRPVKNGYMLNRPMDKLIIMETAEGNAEPPENVIYVRPYLGEGNDTALMDILCFFRVIALAKPPDVRPLLTLFKRHGVHYFKQKYETAMKRREEQLAKQKALAAAQQQQQLPPKDGWW